MRASENLASPSAGLGWGSDGRHTAQQSARGPGRADRAPSTVRTAHRARSERAVRQSKGNLGGRIQRAARQVSSDDMRGHPRAVPRPHGTVSQWRRSTRHELPVHGRLRGSRISFRGNRESPGGPEGSVSRKDHHPSWKPRKQTDHAGVRGEDTANATKRSSRGHERSHAISRSRCGCRTFRQVDVVGQRMSNCLCKVCMVAFDGGFCHSIIA